MQSAPGFVGVLPRLHCTSWQTLTRRTHAACSGCSQKLASFREENVDFMPSFVVLEQPATAIQRDGILLAAHPNGIELLGNYWSRRSCNTPRSFWRFFVGGANWVDQGSFFSFENVVNFIRDDFLCNFWRKRIEKTLKQSNESQF